MRSISHNFMITNNLISVLGSYRRSTPVLRPRSKRLLGRAAPLSLRNVHASLHARLSQVPAALSIFVRTRARWLWAHYEWTRIWGEKSFPLSDYSSLLISLFSYFSGLKRWTASCFPKTSFAMISAEKKSSSLLKSLPPTLGQALVETASAPVTWSICQNLPKASKLICEP